MRFVLCLQRRRLARQGQRPSLLGVAAVVIVVLAVLAGCAAPLPALPPVAVLPPDQPETGQAKTGEAPAAEPTVGALEAYTGTVMLPTYPYERYQTPAYDAQYKWPYQQFDYERFRLENPAPELRSYRTITLENEYLRLIVLPELGGRLWRVIHKPTGDDLFYHNGVVKPSPWGPAGMGGWLALGGLEWDLPVAEHGYAWGTPWTVEALTNDGHTASVTLALPRDGRTLAASIQLSLHAGEAAFTVAPTITNTSQAPVRFAFWHSAALAPGKANQPSADTRFVVPGDTVTVHSTDDATLPGPGHTLAWPAAGGRDLSRLGNWTGYLGFFERPAAHGPFVGVYDEAQDAGVVRVYPAAIARGSKVFGLGYHAPLDPAYYTADSSTYVELHGGIAPTFADQVALGPGETIGWAETWYPVAGIGSLRAANADGALTWTRQSNDALRVGFYPTRPLVGTLVVRADGREVARLPVTATPDAPWVEHVRLDPAPAAGAALVLTIENAAGTPVLVADEAKVR